MIFQNIRPTCPTSVLRLDARRSPKNKVPSNPSNMSNLFPRAWARACTPAEAGGANLFSSNFYFRLDMLDGLDGANKSGAFPRPTSRRQVGHVGRALEAAG